MDRREFLNVAAVALPVAGFALRPSVLRAQDDWVTAVVKDVIEEQAWTKDKDVYRRYRWGAFTHESLVRYFGPPEGRVPQPSQSGLKHLRGSLPVNYAKWLRDGAPLVAKFANDKKRDLVDVLVRTQRDNSGRHTMWLNRVGLVPSGEISRTILAGQALATVVTLAQGKGAGSVEDRIKMLAWWFYPFCWAS